MIPYKSHGRMAVPDTGETQPEILKAIHALMAQSLKGHAVRKFDPDQPRVPAAGASDSSICRAVHTQLCWQETAQRLAVCLSAGGAAAELLRQLWLSQAGR